MKNLLVSKIQLSNATDTAFMNMTYKNEPGIAQTCQL